MHRISFRSSFRDQQEGLRVALSQMTPFYQIIWGFCLLLMTGGLVMILWSKGYPATWPPTQLPTLPVLLHIGLPVDLGLAAPFSVVIVHAFLVPFRTVQLSPKNFTVNYRFGVNRILWKNVTAILDTGEHICFCPNFPSAIVIPRSAFPNPAQADAFLEEAKYYWECETGRSEYPVINAEDVWPPAPRFGA